jgi:DNA-binding GntR family transcriptional regulator
MSRTPVREAIHRLIAEGLLIRLRGRGTFVRSLSRDEVCSVYEYAEGLEGMVAFLAAKKYDPKSERRILEPIEVMETEIDKSTDSGTNEIAWAAADRRFHESLYEICPNRIIVEGLKRVNAQIQLVRIGASGVLLNRRKSTQDHRDTATAIISGDAHRARDTMQRHWERIRTELMKGMI